MARLLEEFIKEQLELPFIWGKTDCCSTCDAWSRRYTGFSPMTRFNSQYSSRGEAMEILERPGGIAVAVNRAMREFPKTKTPQIGDIGLCIFGEKIFPAIKTENGWFSRGEEGFVMAPDFWKAWDLCLKH